MLLACQTLCKARDRQQVKTRLQSEYMELLPQMSGRCATFSVIDRTNAGLGPPASPGLTASPLLHQQKTCGCSASSSDARLHPQTVPPPSLLLHPALHPVSTTAVHVPASDSHANTPTSSARQPCSAPPRPCRAPTSLRPPASPHASSHAPWSLGLIRCCLDL